MTNMGHSGSDGDTRLKPTYNPAVLRKELRELSFGLDMKYINIENIMEKVARGIPDCVDWLQVIQYTAETLASLTSMHPDHSTLAARLEISQLHQFLKNTTFTENLGKLRTISRVDTRKGEMPNKRQRIHRAPQKGVISQDFYEMALKHEKRLNKAIVHERDFYFTYFGWKTLCQSYLVKKDTAQIHETPQFMFMRVALAIHGPFGDIDAVLNTYELMSQKFFIHASPTLFNAGTVNQYLSSCFLVSMKEDSIDGIFKTLHETALISKASGGIGIHVSNIRGSGAYVSGSNGVSNGLVPMLRVFNNTARYVDQGGNKRPGAYCIYLEPWHSDVFDFLQLRKNHGKEELRARDLFLALWIPDLFMKRVQSNGEWCLFSPDEAPGLNDVYGEEFEELYEKYETTPELPVKRIKAQKLWSEILQSQVETGGPFMLYKDVCNSKSNQKNLGTIKSSNLCCEIVEYSSENETAVCNLASVALPSFIVQMANKGSIFDFAKLHSVVKTVTKNLDRVIDICKYPTPQTEYSNRKNRPLAIGVQGLADVFLILKIPFESLEATVLNKQIFETIYHAAVETSIELAVKHGSYESFQGSPASEGKLQFDLWDLNEKNYEFLYHDWGSLKKRIQNGAGLRNSLLVGPMPTASTSQILGFTESFEPMTSNVYSRRVLSGEFINVNQYMVRHFSQLGIWDEKLKNRIVADNGSIQNVQGLPDWIKHIYKTVWEIPQRCLIDMARDRSPFIDQSQSLNLFMKAPTMGKLTSMHFYAWKQGLKTGMYYLRTQAASAAIQFTINEENTLVGPVMLNEAEADGRLSMGTVLGRYPESSLTRRHIEFFSRVGTSIENTEKDKTEQNTMNWGEDTYGIHDKTPLFCAVAKDNQFCDSCSG